MQNPGVQHYQQIPQSGQQQFMNQQAMMSQVPQNMNVGIGVQSMK